MNGHQGMLEIPGDEQRLGDAQREHDRPAGGRTPRVGRRGAQVRAALADGRRLCDPGPDWEIEGDVTQDTGE